MEVKIIKNRDSEIRGILDVEETVTEFRRKKEKRKDNGSG